MQRDLVAQFAIAAPAFVVFGGTISRRQEPAAAGCALGRSCWLPSRARCGASRPRSSGARRPSESTRSSPSRPLAAAAPARRAILRFDSETEATVMGSWADHEGGRYSPGTVSDRPGATSRRPPRIGGPAREGTCHPVARSARLGYSRSIVAPVQRRRADLGRARGRRPRAQALDRRGRAAAHGVRRAARQQRSRASRTASSSTRAGIDRSAHRACEPPRAARAARRPRSPALSGTNGRFRSPCSTSTTSSRSTTSAATTPARGARPGCAHSSASLARVEDIARSNRRRRVRVAPARDHTRAGAGRGRARAPG